MGWEETGVTDLLNIPSGMQMHWKFFNAFFKAFQERAYYAEVGPRPVFYDDLILDGPQISQTELKARLDSFNAAIQLNWTVSTLPFPPFTKTLAEQWLKVDTWDEFGTFTSALEDDLVDEDFWDYAEVRTLLTDDVFDSILVDYTFESNFHTTYWTGVYQLINLMEYRGLTIDTAVEPLGIFDDERDPRMYCNDRESFPNTASNQIDLDQMMLDSITESVFTIGAGTTTITSGKSRISDGIFANDDDELQTVSAEYNGMAGEPFVITPLAMEIRTRLQALDIDWHLDEQRQSSFTAWNAQDTKTRTPVTASLDVILESGVVTSIIYAPDAATYDATRYTNLNIPVNFDMLTGENSLDKSVVPDIRLVYTVDTTPVAPVPFPPVGGITFHRKNREQTNSFILDRAICRIPLEFLEYQEQTPP